MSFLILLGHKANTARRGNIGELQLRHTGRPRLVQGRLVQLSQVGEQPTPFFSIQYTVSLANF
jgi:hypothetical protein